MDINDTGKPVPREVFMEKAKEATGIIVGVDELDEDLLRQCKNLKAIVKFGVGTDNIDLKVCEELRIKVGRCLGTNSNAVAELTVGMMFACARDLVANAITVKNGGWIKPTGFELKGKNLESQDLEISEKMLQEWQKESVWKFLYMMFLIFRRMYWKNIVQCRRLWIRF